MIPRYSRPEMARIWEPETRFGIWLKIETYAAEAMAKLGLIPVHAADAVKTRGGFDIARIDEIERVTQHDVIAFTTAVGVLTGLLFPLLKGKSFLNELD
jgi:adenylosuccinate lyase